MNFKFKSLLEPTTLNILLLLSLIIIIILIYLKNKKIELFNSLFMDKYINAQNINKNIQNIMKKQDKKINNLGNDIQTVLQGDLLPTLTN